jgi:SAM-dependent methyltransferase
MTRVLEPELMVDDVQVQEYTEACSYPSLFGGLALYAIKRMNGDETARTVADLGCGPCLYHQDFYALFPNATVSAYDASQAMLEEAAKNINSDKTKLIAFNINDVAQSEDRFDVIFSSLVLHQLHDPGRLWAAVKNLGAPGTKFVVFDLLHIDDDAKAEAAIDALIPKGLFGSVFRQDFRRSLRAAFSIEEIYGQIGAAGLSATVHTIELSAGCAAVCVEGTLS